MQTTKSSETDLNPLKKLKKVTWITGAWPLSDDLFSIFRTFLFVIIQTCLVTFATLEIVLGCTDPDETLNCIELQKFGAISAVKVILLRFYRKTLARIISASFEDWKTKNPKSIEIMISHARTGNFVFYAQIISTASLAILLIIAGLPYFSPAVNNNLTNNTEAVFISRRLPLGNKCLFINSSTTTYVFIYILQSVQLLGIGFGNVGVDIFYFCLAMHICGQLEVLYEEMTFFEVTDDVKETKIRIVALIKSHRHLWRVALEFERTFNLSILIQLLINITGICAYGIQALKRMQSHNGFEGLNSFFAVELLMVQLFVYCYAGEQLSSSLLKLSLAIYQSSWYNLSKSLSPDVYFILIITALPYTLTAGKMMIMNMSTFTNIVKTTASFFSVLRLKMDA